MNNNRDIKVVAGGGGATQGLFHNIVSVSNLLSAWQEFRCGKRKKKDVADFELHLEDNLFLLNEKLQKGIYIPDPYQPFSISDPKPRQIHKATVRDRVLNQAIFRVLYPVFNKSFIYDSYSSRKGKGTHVAVSRLFNATQKVSKNWKCGGYVLKCDIAKFFDSVDHDILFEFLKNKIKDKQVLILLEKIIQSFEKTKNKGIPLGNVTSQLFANVYLHELDHFVKHTLRVRYYFRYADDFVILDTDKNVLENYEKKMREFLLEQLQLRLHDNKVFIRKISQGIDFLGYVVLPYTLVLRTKTKNRILRKITNPKNEKDEKFFQKLDSYLAILKHCKSSAIKKEIFESLIDL
jgi:RNA-directed DNA polymerase